MLTERKMHTVESYPEAIKNNSTICITYFSSALTFLQKKEQNCIFKKWYLIFFISYSIIRYIKTYILSYFIILFRHLFTYYSGYLLWNITFNRTTRNSFLFFDYFVIIIPVLKNCKFCYLKILIWY